MRTKWRTKLDKTTHLPGENGRMQNCKRRGHYEKRCRSTQRVQYFEKTTSSAEENWDYNRVQRINDKEQKKDFYNATLLVNNVPKKFIIDSGSPVTLIPECLFNDIATIKPLKTTYKNVNNQRIEFTGRMNALVKTNKETIELPLLITKAKTSPLMGLDWMQQLKINLSSNNEAIQIHIIKLDNMDKKRIKLQNDFKDLFYNYKKIKNLSVKIQMKEGAQIIQQKARPIPIHLQDQVALELKTTYQTRILGKSNGNHRRLFCESRSDYNEKRQINKKCPRLQKTQRIYKKKKNSDAKYGKANFTDNKKDIQRKRRRNFGNKIRF